MSGGDSDKRPSERQSVLDGFNAGRIEFENKLALEKESDTDNRPEITYRARARRAALLHLFEFAAGRPAQLRRCAKKIMRSDVRQTRCGDVRFQDLSDNLLAHSHPTNLIAAINRTEQVPVSRGGLRRPLVDRVFNPSRHRDRPHPAVFADQIHDAPPTVPLLNVSVCEVRQFGPAQSATEQCGEHGPVAQPLLFEYVRVVQQGLRSGTMHLSQNATY